MYFKLQDCTLRYAALCITYVIINIFSNREENLNEDIENYKLLRLII